ncbi:MAG: HNH endonuclease [Bdellovibrionaceae bacterium]|nr:HNH endonuclease [Pseudobdellovibrionaceae bacterium]
MFNLHGKSRVPWIIGLLLLVAPSAFASDLRTYLSGKATDPSREIEYFTLDDTATVKRAEWEDPIELMTDTEFLEDLQAAASSLSLLKWIHHDKAPPVASENYVRRKHFGAWVNDPDDDNCYNTRAKVLIRDSSKPVTYRGNNKCIVDKGLWKDPYTGDLFDSSRQIQIDHMVPLKHAYIAGGWQWTSETRCLYANFLANTYHLISASGRENMRKGDRSPADYMPPNQKYQCDYLTNWLKIKLIWKMMMFSDETEKISDLLAQNNCDTRALKITRTELAKMRGQMRNPGACEAFKREAIPAAAELTPTSEVF